MKFIARYGLDCSIRFKKPTSDVQFWAARAQKIAKRLTSQTSHTCELAVGLMKAADDLVQKFPLDYLNRHQVTTNTLILVASKFFNMIHIAEKLYAVNKNRKRLWSTISSADADEVTSGRSNSDAAPQAPA